MNPLLFVACLLFIHFPCVIFAQPCTSIRTIPVTPTVTSGNYELLIRNPTNVFVATQTRSGPLQLEVGANTLQRRDAINVQYQFVGNQFIVTISDDTSSRADTSSSRADASSSVTSTSTSEQTNEIQASTSTKAVLPSAVLASSILTAVVLGFNGHPLKGFSFMGVLLIVAVMLSDLPQSECQGTCDNGIVTIYLPSNVTLRNTVLFRDPFENPGPNNQYGFGYIWPQSSTTWQTQHLPNGGWDGRGAARITLAGCTTDCNRETNQWSIGWHTPSLNHNFTLGDDVYIRFRIRFNDANRWCDDECGTGNKFIMMGMTRTLPFNSRIIVYQWSPSESSTCQLGSRDWEGTGQVFPWATPSYFGLPYSNWQQTNRTFGSIEPYVNIGGHGSCSPATLTTYGNHPNPPAPGPNSAAPRNGWYHYQIYAKSGNNVTSGFAVWVNNNNFSAPTSFKIGLNDGLGAVGWEGGAWLGGYPSVTRSDLNLGWDMDDFEIGLSFDPLWYPTL